MKSPDQVVVHVPRRFTRNSWGGTERVLEQTLPLLGELGYRSQIFTTDALDRERHERMGRTEVTRFSYFYPEFPLSRERKLAFDNKGGNSVSLPLAAALAQVKDLALVDLHSGNILGAACRYVAQLRKVPTVLTLHGGHFAIPQEERANLSQKESSRPRSGLPLRRLFSYPLRADRLLEDVDAIVCVGIDEYEAAKKALPGKRLLLLPGGVNMSDFEQADRNRGRAILGVPLDRKLIVCVARIDHQKDQATLVRAWSHHLSADCDLALVGPETTPGFVADLKNMAQKQGGRLFITGGLSPEDMPHVYAAGDISVLPSRHEPFGLTCLESWAAGTPLVASKVGGPEWLLRDETEGLLFPVGDHTALGRTLERLLASPDLGRQLAESGRRRAHEYSWTERARRLASLYGELIAARAGSST
jgi:glycosyltransferase involved in cell wall biosynthesis